MDGYIKVAAAVPNVCVADAATNTQRIENLLLQAEAAGAQVVCFPELSITGYTCQDLFQQRLLLEDAETSVLKLLELSRSMQAVCLVGLPVSNGGMLLNSAAVIQGGKIFGLVPKTYIPNYKEFYEARWFSSATRVAPDTSVRLCGQNVPLSANLLFRTPNFTFGIEVCEDLWATVPPSSRLSLEGADIIFNLSASNELCGKHDYLRSLVLSQSARCLSGYVYAGSGMGESSQDTVYSGLAFIAENGQMVAEGEHFLMKEQLIVSEIDIDYLRTQRLVNTTFASAQDIARQHSDAFTTCRFIDMPEIEVPLERQTPVRPVDALPFGPRGPLLDERCEEILCIQSHALARRLSHIGCKKAVIGISGGLDSTLALLVTVNAFDCLGLDRRGIVGITMPGFGTTDRTYHNALNLMKELGITMREISIRDACLQHFRDLGMDPTQHDTTYENAQARERTQILMDAAGQEGGIVIGTGDLSELALGWCTYNGDHMSMYGVNASVPKTLVRHLVRFVATHAEEEAIRTTLLDIVATPISPELLPPDAEGNISQRTEDLVGPYELHDFFLFHTLRNAFPPAKVYRLALRAFDGHCSDVPSLDAKTILHWLQTFYRRFFSQQFKRSCMPDGPKVGSVSLSPRGDWRMPSDAQAAAWLRECENLATE
ncbi:MAG: NAD(+) synthase [Alloprevotella sp.]|nr:NAD(+) synthase [Alloprevotella sp.]